MATVVVTLIVAFLLAMPPQLCIRKAIHNDVSARRRWSPQRYSSQVFADFSSLMSDGVIEKIDKNFPLIATFSCNCPGELHYQLQ